jgi:hypothetical protein
LFNGNKQRGSVSFNTLIDVGDATLIYPEDDLNVAIANASSGDVLVLFPGDYLEFIGTITLDKSITLRGLYPYDKPTVHVAFILASGLSNLELIDLDLDGTGKNTLIEIPSGTTGITFNSVILSSCNIHDYARQLIYGNAASTLGSFTVDDCVISNFVAGGGDFIDFRAAHVTSVSLTNSTFNNCAPARDFIRIDNGAFTGTGLNSNVFIDHCTIYGSSNTLDRILYVRFATNTLTVQNTIIAGTDGFYTNQTSTSQPTCSNNNYFNAPGFYTTPYLTVTNLKIDISGSHTTVDPGFTNAAEGNFTVSNQTLLDNEVGDPRWRQ